MSDVWNEHYRDEEKRKALLANLKDVFKKKIKIRDMPIFADVKSRLDSTSLSDTVADNFFKSELKFATQK